MKHLKMLGLAAVAAMALTAFVGASSASATVLCETTVTAGCGGTAWEWANGSTLTMSLQSGGTARLRDPIFGTTINTCTKSTVTGNVEQGTPNNTPGGNASVTFESCTTPVTEATGGNIEIHSIANSHSGTVTANGFAFTFTDPFGNMCSYGAGAGLDLGNFVPGANGTDGTIAINKSVPLIAAHSDSGCIGSGIWTATYTQTTNTDLFISAS